MQKESVFILRMDESEKASISTTAKSYGMSMSDYGRMLLKLGEARFAELASESKMEQKAKALMAIK